MIDAARNKPASAGIERIGVQENEICYREIEEREY